MGLARLVLVAVVLMPVTACQFKNCNIIPIQDSPLNARGNETLSKVADKLNSQRFKTLEGQIGQLEDWGATCRYRRESYDRPASAENLRFSCRYSYCSRGFFTDVFISNLNSFVVGQPAGQMASGLPEVRLQYAPFAKPRTHSGLRRATHANSNMLGRSNKVDGRTKIVARFYRLAGNIGLHTGIVWIDEATGEMLHEMNFQSNIDGAFEGAGYLSTPNDTLGYVAFDLAVFDFQSLDLVTYDRAFAERLWEQTLEVSERIATLNLPYEASTLFDPKSVNSHTGARFIMEMVLPLDSSDERQERVFAYYRANRRYGVFPGVGRIERIAQTVGPPIDYYQRVIEQSGQPKYIKLGSL